jgi:hypothetical protein
MSDYDSPWREALDRSFELFLAFFFPQAHADIDWSRLRILAYLSRWHP